MPAQTFSYNASYRADIVIIIPNLYEWAHIVQTFCTVFSQLVSLEQHLFSMHKNILYSLSWLHCFTIPY